MFNLIDFVSLITSVASLLVAILSLNSGYLQTFGKKVLIAEIIIERVKLERINRMVDDFFERVPELKTVNAKELTKLVARTKMLVVFRIVNSGLFDIKKDDFDDDIIISFGKNSEILKWGLAKTTNRQVKIKVTPKRMTISPITFNRGESLTISAEIGNYEKMKVYAHFLGREGPVRVLVNTSPMKKLILFGTSLSISVSLIIAAVFNLAIPNIARFLLLIAVLFLSIYSYLRFSRINISEKYDLEDSGSELPDFD